jgi:hypothetical protein
MLGSSLELSWLPAFNSSAIGCFPVSLARHRSEGVRAKPCCLAADFKWPVYLAYPIYLICFAEFALACVHRFGYYAGIYGTLDEKNVGRDRIPDSSIPQLAVSPLKIEARRSALEDHLVASALSPLTVAEC